MAPLLKEMIEGHPHCLELGKGTVPEMDASL
jgi:hypothetical protein